jgi:hypothetical protein
VALKAAFLHLKALTEFNKNKDNPDAAIALIDEALAIDPNFNLASLSKQALEARKNPPAPAPAPDSVETEEAIVPEKKGKKKKKDN